MKRELNEGFNKEKKVKYDIKNILFDIISDQNSKRPFYLFIAIEKEIENDFLKEICKLKREKKLPKYINLELKKKQMFNNQKDIITILEIQKEGIWCKVQEDEIINLS